ncbi:phage integrase [Pseudoteredinibacter isoporae]|uniref:Integrase n=1 Tax=Pseudoteredinibacter isoporae TaxID=570281 RepID=A0A7X0JS70_9GAMM|nr:tyrosine-type recombinase/integrase [Pseudoteredinibacter isoporae]MBB6521319.1 integrase [Pseudoteredinibacter isoporae]NHO86874.1 tyrosine-type recombinase/integrase [Pseudoteredinibacter isoporae]NIB24674.1 tyrosine-type recombinase/integrase [Pseudoteredinibacter isoporae]
MLKVQKEYDDKKAIPGFDYKLRQLVDLWYNNHGISLKDHKYRYSRLIAIIERIGNPKVSEFETADFVEYRTQRLRDVSISTVNHETRYLRAVFSELDRLGLYTGENPLRKIRTFKVPETELSYLEQDQIALLLRECDQSRNNHTGVVARICLMTGARWGEANGLKRSNLLPNAIRFVDTKNGKVRAVPVPEWLIEKIRNVSFPSPYPNLFSSCKSAFRSALDRTGIELPAGQMTHVLRHTFASHFMMNGGNILTLQRVLGHSDLKITMRYAHLAPDYMDQIVKLGLSKICI